jgi:hypothetical protein
MKKDSGRKNGKDSARQTEISDEAKLVKTPYPDIETLKKHVLGVDSYDFFFFETRVRELIAE